MKDKEQELKRQQRIKRERELKEQLEREFYQELDELDNYQEQALARLIASSPSIRIKASKKL